MDEILKEFVDKVIIRGNQYLFHVNDAVTIVEKCRELKKRILAIETFVIKGIYIQPEDVMSYEGPNYETIDPQDYYKRFHVRKNSDEGHWAEAINFIKNRAATLEEGEVFEIDYEK